MRFKVYPGAYKRERWNTLVNNGDIQPLGQPGPTRTNTLWWLLVFVFAAGIGTGIGIAIGFHIR